jgi:hypothetical protein
MNDYSELVSDLTSMHDECIVIGIGTFPRTGHTGLLPEQGLVIEAAKRRLVELQGCSVYRILWTQLVGLWRTSMTLSATRQLMTIVGQVLDAGVEVRTLWTTIHGPRSPEWIAGLIADLALRNNFGAFTGATVFRLVDGVAWPAQPRR